MGRTENIFEVLEISQIAKSYRLRRLCSGFELCVSMNPHFDDTDIQEGNTVLLMGFCGLKKLTLFEILKIKKRD